MRSPLAPYFASFAPALVLAVMGSTLASAGDWPQILGPARNGIAEGESLQLPWPATGPRIEWTRELGEGFAGPAVVAGKVLVFHRVEDRERVEALDAGTGRVLWQTDFEATYRGGINPDRGPRCVPLVHGQRVVIFGAAGDLHCVSLGKGEKLWSRATWDDFEGKEGYFGAGATPIVVGERVLVNVGGAKGSGIVAFELDTGRTAWQASNEGASYSSPTYLAIAGKPHALFVARLNALAIDPRNGNIAWSVPFGQTGPTVNAAVPLVVGDKLFLTASYGIGAQLLALGPAMPREVWGNDDTLSSQYNTPVVCDGYLYGIHGREDVGQAELRCVELLTGKVAWRETEFGAAHAILAGDKLLLTRLTGEVVAVDATPTQYRLLAKATVGRAEMRALPALSNGRLLVRDNQGASGKLYCVRVGK